MNGLNGTALNVFLVILAISQGQGIAIKSQRQKGTTFSFYCPWITVSALGIIPHIFLNHCVCSGNISTYLSSQVAQDKMTWGIWNWFWTGTKINKVIFHNWANNAPSKSCEIHCFSLQREQNQGINTDYCYMLWLKWKMWIVLKSTKSLRGCNPFSMPSVLGHLCSIGC